MKNKNSWTEREREWCIFAASTTSFRFPAGPGSSAFSTPESEKSIDKEEEGGGEIDQRAVLLRNLSILSRSVFIRV